jgi:hypothetical protein
VVTRGGVLTGEGVSSDVGELRELRGGETGEGGLNWGKKGSEAALTEKLRTAVALRQNPTQRRGLRWWQPVR